MNDDARLEALRRRDYIRTPDEILARIYSTLERPYDWTENHLAEALEYMRQAKFIPLILRRVYQGTTESDWGGTWSEDRNNDGRCTVKAENISEISECAQTYLSSLERAVRRTNGPQVTSMLARYRAWKWLLGHTDADTFHLSECAVTGHFHLSPIEIYARVLKQFTSGEWDRMTKAAQKAR